MNDWEIAVRRGLAQKKIRGLDSVVEAVVFDTVTGAHTFTSVVANVLGTSHLILTMSRDYFDTNLATDIVGFMRAQRHELDSTTDFLVVSGFASPGYLFDCLLILWPSMHRYFTGDSDSLHLHTLVALPIFHCEFTNSDTPDLVGLVRRKYVNSLDWDREPSPRVWIRYQNSITRSVGKGLGLIKVEDSLVQIHRLEEDPYQFADVKNYLNEQIRITTSRGAWLVTFTSEALVLEPDQFDPWFHTFLNFGRSQAGGTVQAAQTK